MMKKIILYFITYLISSLFFINSSFAVWTILIEWQITDPLWNPMKEIPIRIEDWTKVFYRITDIQWIFKFNKEIADNNKSFLINLYNYNITFNDFTESTGQIKLTYDVENNNLVDYSPSDNAEVVKLSKRKVIWNYRSIIFHGFFIINFFLFTVWTYLAYTKFLNRPKK